MKKDRLIDVYEVSTSLSRHFWVLATSPGRAISKLKRRGRVLLDRGERITGSSRAGTIDVR